MDLFSLVLTCVPFVASNTMLAIIHEESRGNPWAIHVNSSQQFKQPHSYRQAVLEAQRLIAAKANIDMGLTQINSKTMKQLGLTVSQVFDPCTNVYAGGTVLIRNYHQAFKHHHSDQAAMQAALSAYNTGSLFKGFKNGYVKKVVNRVLTTYSGY